MKFEYLFLLMLLLLFLFGFVSSESKSETVSYKDSPEFIVGGWTPINELMRGNMTIVKQDGLYYANFKYQPYCLGCGK